MPFSSAAPYTHKREPLTRDEAARLSAACSSRQERLIIWTLLDTGLRVSELCSLTHANIDFQQHQIVFHGKGDKRRVVGLTPRIQALLESHFATNDLPNGIGFCRKTAWVCVKAVANRAKISRPCSPHVLRHTFAVSSIQKGISLPALQKVIGHTNLATTQIYLNMQPEEALREYREKF